MRGRRVIEVVISKFGVAFFACGIAAHNRRFTDATSGGVRQPVSYTHLLRQRKAAQTEPLEYAAHVAAAGPGSSPETAASSRQLGALLRIAIGELPPRAAEMFILRYVEEHGNREIAALMGTSQAVVAVRCV